MKASHGMFWTISACLCLAQLPAVETAYEGTIDLAGTWRLEQVGKSEVNCPIAVPGDVHSALLAAKIIPDPYYSANEYLTLWVGRADWIQRRTFDVAADFLAAPNVILRLDGSEKKVCRTDEIYIPGPHNLENALGAVCVAAAMNVPVPVIRHSLKTFRGVEHRIETVRELNGVE
jgi:hypothetical protein